MSNCTVSTNINSLQDVYNFRSKVYDVVGKLSGQEVQSSRLACGISTHLSQLIKLQPSCLVDTKISIENQKASIHFLLPNPPRMNGEVTKLASFFDRINAEGNQLLGLAKDFIFSGNAEQNLLQVEEILLQKSKEELMTAIEAQNKELQLSFENLKKTNLEKARMENELNVAKDIQLSMLPLDFPAFPDRKDIDIYAQLIPAREVGGDFYDFYFLDEHHLGFAVGDVSGKGVPAALMMAVCKTLLKSRASVGFSTASILSHVNTEMAKDNKNYMFVTVFMAILNTQTGELTYTNAGHNPTYIRKATGSLLKLTDLHGPVIAAMEGLEYKETKIQIDTNDVIFAYTDGIPEAHNEQGVLFTDNKLSDLLDHNPFNSTRETVEAIVDATLSFTGNAEQFDDITALCIEYKGITMTNFSSKKITIKNTLEEIQLAIQVFEEFAEEHKMSISTMMKINIVLDELLSNIVKYGFPEDKEGKIDVSLELFSTSKLTIILSDQGIPFNPFQTTIPNLDASIEDREIGGLGILLVKELMDEYSYQRTLDLNVVSMIKHNNVI